MRSYASTVRDVGTTLRIVVRRKESKKFVLFTRSAVMTSLQGGFETGDNKNDIPETSKGK